MNKGKKKQIVCMFGMARSGTSFVSHLVGEMGVYLGDRKELCFLSNLDGFNPDGIFERQDVMDVNDKLLSLFGAQGRELYELPHDWKKRVAGLREKIRDIIHSMPTSKLCGIKNNYMAVLFPVWADVFLEEGVEISCVHIVRHPRNVIKSAYRAWHADARNVLYTWYCRNRHAMMATQFGRYKMVLYDELMANPESALGSLANFLGVKADVRKVAKLIKQQLFHNKELAGDNVQNELYRILKEFGKAVEENDRNQMDALTKEYLSYESIIDQPCHLDDAISMSLDCKISNDSEIIYFGSANWGDRDTFSIQKTYERLPAIHKQLKCVLATQAMGKCYGAYYEITACKVNGKECFVEIKRQPTIRDLNLQFAIITDENEISSIEIIGKVRIDSYPTWYRVSRRIMPLRLRNILRAIGVRKKYGK